MGVGDLSEPTGVLMNRDERIAQGRIDHGLGQSEYFPGNVQHLVSPIVGILRLKEADGDKVGPSTMAYMIDRLSLLLDLAVEQDEKHTEEERKS